VKTLNFNKVEDLKKYNDFLRRSHYYDFFQTIDWFLFKSVEEKYIFYKEDGGKIKFGGVIFVLEKAGTKYLYCPRGPVINYNNLSELKEFIGELEIFARKKGYRYLKLDPKISTIKREDLEKLFICNINEQYDTQKDSSCDALLLLDVDAETILKRFKKKTRYNIKLAKEKGVKTDIYIDLNKINLNEFYNLYLETSARHNFKPYPKEYFENFINKIDKDKLIFCKASYKNEPLFISINIKYREKIISLYGARSNKMSNLKASYLADYEMINYAINNNYKYYDFGGIYCKDNQVNHGDYGLLKYKQGFCTSGFTNYVGEIIIDLKNYKRGEK